MSLSQVDVRALPPERLESVIGSDRRARFEEVARSAREWLRGRAVINVNSTAAGGGVAELLQTLLAYVRGVGVDARWVVIRGNPAFFKVTKHLHNNLYGFEGSDGAQGSVEREVYEETLAGNAAELLALVRAGDVVVLHDPQTAGLADSLASAGAHVVWRCHVGIDVANEHSERAWAFLHPYLERVSAFVFSRAKFAPPWIPSERLFVIPPSIDPFSAKNEEMDPADVLLTLQYVGLLDGGGGQPLAQFTRRDGSPGRIDRHVDILQTGSPPPFDAPLVVQASRWDRLKDMPGVMESFAEHLAGSTAAHLVLAGPAVHGVIDDPEAAEVLDDCVALWRRLPAAARTRIHLACVPMGDVDEAAAIVNALQRHATVVAQKSLAEGFGLTVAEAMWKARPVVGSAVGGIVDQIVPGETGVLVEPPDLAGFAVCVRELLDDPIMSGRFGERARVRANEHFLGDRHLEQWAELFKRLDLR